MANQVYTASFGSTKAGLTNVQIQWLKSDKTAITGWTNSGVTEVAGGLYRINATQPTTAYWLVWRTGETSGEVFLVTSVHTNAYVFNFGTVNTGKSVGYTYYDRYDNALSVEIISGVVEYGTGTGMYLASHPSPPINGAYLVARTIETTPKYATTSLDISPTVATEADSENTSIFYTYQETIRDTLKTRIVKFFELDTTLFPYLQNKIPTIIEWKRGMFDTTEVFIDKIFPTQEREFPAIVIGISSVSQNPIGIGDLVGYYDGDDGKRYRRKGIQVAADVTLMIGARDDTVREYICDFLMVMLGRLSHDRMTGTDYWMEINDDVSIGSYGEEDLSEVSSIQKIWTGEINFSIIMEGYEDTEVSTLLGVKHVNYDQFDATDLDGTGTDTLVPSQDDTIY